MRNPKRATTNHSPSLRQKRDGGAEKERLAAALAAEQAEAEKERRARAAAEQNLAAALEASRRVRVCDATSLEAAAACVTQQLVA